LINAKDGDKAHIQELAKELGLPEIKPVSSIIREKKERMSGAGEVNPLNSAKLLVFDADGDGDSCNPSGYWKKEKVKAKEGGVYVGIDRYKIHGNDPSCWIARYTDILQVIGEDISDLVIIGAKSASVGLLVDSDLWVSLKDYTETKAREYLDANNLVERMGLRLSIQQLQGHNHYTALKVMKGLDAEISKPLGKFFAKVGELKVKLGDTKDLEAFMNRSNGLFNFNAEANTVKLHSEFCSLMDHYPMLRIMSYWDLSGNEVAIKEYIDAIDSLK